MPSLQSVKRKINSVKKTQKITKAMKMVAAAKLKRAQQRILAFRPYGLRMRQAITNLSGRANRAAHPLLQKRPVKTIQVSIVTSDRGLCGAFNTNLIKAAQTFVRDNPGKQIDILAVGRKGRDFFRRRGANLVGEYIAVTGKGRVDFSEALEIARDVTKRFTEDEAIDKAFVIYNEFKSVMQQRVATEQLLPVARATAGDSEPTPADQQLTLVDYIYEQPPAEIFAQLLPRLVETQIFRALLESIASEQGARMTAMDSASKNARELIDSLTLNMNRVRQAAITNEIIEVVSGAAAQ